MKTYLFLSFEIVELFQIYLISIIFLSMDRFRSQDLNDCCQLNFSNKLLKSPKLFVQSKQILPKILNFTKKHQKKSLKRIFSDKALQLRRNPFLQNVQSKKQDSIKNILYESNDYGNSIEQSPHIEPINKRNLINKQYHRFHKSLEKQPTHYITQNNPINQLKEFRNKQQKSLKYSEPLAKFVQPVVKVINNPPRTINIASRQNLSSNKVNFLKFVQPVDLVNSISFNEIKKRSNISNMKQSSPMKISFQQPILEKSNIFKKSLAYQGAHSNKEIQSALYSEKFNKLYGEMDIAQEIKRDLVTSLDMEYATPTKHLIKNGHGLFSKNPQSMVSTMIQSQSKLKPQQTQSTDYFDSSTSIKYKNFQSQTFNKVNRPFEDIFSPKFKSTQFLTVKSPDYPIQNSTQHSGIAMNSDEFRNRCERRQQFKSIVSINSQHDSTESVDSIIIDTHPKQLMSSKPIKNLI